MSISATLEVVFEPNTPGSKSAILMIPTNATLKPYEVALSGFGISSNTNQATKSIINETDSTPITDQISAASNDNHSMGWGWIMLILGVAGLVIFSIIKTKSFRRK